MSSATLTDAVLPTTQTHETEGDPAVALVERIIAEGPIGMQAAARLVGTFRAGARTHPSTVTRWCNSGVKMSDGRVLRLESIRTSGKIATSRAAIVRFLAAQQRPQGDATESTPAPRSPAATTRASAKAAEYLDNLGIK